MPVLTSDLRRIIARPDFENLVSLLETTAFVHLVTPMECLDVRPESSSHGVP